MDKTPKLQLFRHSDMEPYIVINKVKCGQSS